MPPRRSPRYEAASSPERDYVAVTSSLRRLRGAPPELTALAEQLGQLDRVRGRALAEVVADDPHVQAAVVRRVASYAAHQHLVAAGSVDRKRVDAVRRVVEHHQA